MNRPLRTIVVVLIVIGALAALDQFLARTERDEVQGAARRSWEKGTLLMREGHAAGALDALRNAHTLVLDNVVYERDMIPALMALGRATEAGPLMDDVLQREPNDGEANLMAARLMAKEGRVKDAEAYYHRAIYGEWPGDAVSRRIDARFELVQYLLQWRSGQEVLAELISLEAEPGLDESRQRRIAQYFLGAGSPSRAAAVYRALLAKTSGSASGARAPEDYKGLGEAEMQLGDYRAARTAFLEASRLQPDAFIAQRLDLLDEVTEIDPTPRRLPVSERYQRSVRILGMAKADLEDHLAQRPSAATDQTAALLNAAAGAGGPSAPHDVINELAEQNLDLASRIWKARIAIFGPSGGDQEEELRLIMTRLGL
jgi:tetratricopeptide (TPR) repeat protein